MCMCVHVFIYLINYLHLHEKLKCLHFIFFIYNNSFLQLKTFIKILEKKVTAGKEHIFSVKELKALAVSENILMDNLISKLNEEGILLKIRKDMYKFIHYTS